MTGEELQAQMTKRIRALLAADDCPLPLTYVSDIGLTRNGIEFMISDDSCDYTISIQFEYQR